MSIFLRLSDRFETGLRILDPFEGERLFKIIDPWQGGNRRGALPWRRMGALLIVLFAPVWLFAWMDSRLLGPRGLVLDVGFYGIMFFSVVSVVLIPLGRRLLGTLLHELVLRGIVEPEIQNLSPRTVIKGKVLTAIEQVTRVDGFRGWVWIALILMLGINGYRVLLRDGIVRWLVVPAQTGFFYPFRVGECQPNFAGAWSMFVLCTVNIYLGVLAARLIVVFACLCARVAGSSHLKIVPADPDGTGGLRPVGQVALFLALFPFSVGISLAAMTSNECLLYLLQGSPGASLSGNNWIMFVFWVAYLILGPLLFFLPLVPLRRRMAGAKRAYLLRAYELKARAEEAHDGDLTARHFDASSLQGMVALDSLIASASEMVIWPFDRKTFLRYAGLLGAPLAPFVAEAIPHVVSWLRRYLGLSA